MNNQETPRNALTQRTASGLRSRRLTLGFQSGLPAKGSYVPFRKDCPYVDAVGIRFLQLEIVVAILAFEVCGESPVTAEQIGAKLGPFTQGEMGRLARSLWIECVGKVPGSSSKLWRATPRARERLAFKDWEVELHSAAKLVALVTDEQREAS